MRSSFLKKPPHAKKKKKNVNLFRKKKSTLASENISTF